MIDAAIARVLLEASLRVCLVALAVAAVLKFARINSSAVRHAAWTSVVVAMLLMPFLPYVVPTIELPGRSRAAAALASAPDQLPIVGKVSLQQPVRSLTVESMGPSPNRAPSAPLFMPAPAARVTAIPRWLLAAVVIYAAGLLMLLARWVLAARFLSKLKRHSTPIATSVTADCYESPLVATPITVGAWAPRIVLPTDWKTWSAAKLAGVLAHEQAHVTRRDPLVTVVAYVNRCIFWFHPLAWWLERKLAATAEDAADEAGARAMGERRDYAQVLVDMATIVSQRGGRVAWQGIGVDGNGLLSRRIERLLGGNAFSEVSRMKKWLVAGVSVAALVIAVACRTPTELKPDPKVAERLAANRNWKSPEEQRAEARAQLDSLKAGVAANPDDLTTLEKLLTAYSLDYSGQPDPKAAEYAAARRPYILKLIKDHPESQLAGSPLARIFPSALDPLPDPVGYAEGKALWLEHLRKPDASASVLSNAARWFETADKLLAEQALKRFAKSDAQSATTRLGRLYAMAIVGSNSSMPLNVRSSDPAEAASPFAVAARKTLEETKDAAMLSSACQAIYSSRSVVAAESRDLALKYCDRALAINPADQWAAGVRRSAEHNQRYSAQRALIGVDKPQRYAKFAALPEGDRLPFAGSLAATSWYDAVDLQYNKHDQAAADVQWKQARLLAEDAVNLTGKMSDRPEAAEQLYQAKVVMAALAVHEGHRKDAVRFLREAGAVPRRMSVFQMSTIEDAVVNQLLKVGERESIIAFYDRVAAIPGMAQDSAKKAAEALRAGTMPMRYQYFLDREAAAAKAKK